MKKNYLSIFWFMLCCIVTIQAQRNYKYENFGNRSILLNGNVTGSVDDLGATFYNPARLALVEEPVFAINGKLYQYTSLKLDDFLGDGIDLKKSDFDGLPSMVAGTFKLDFLEGHQFAYSLLSRNRSEIDLSYNTGLIIDDITDEYPGDEDFIGRIGLGSNLKEDWFGLSWAKSITSNLSIGASGFFSVYNYSGGSRLHYVVLSEDEEVGLLNNVINFEQKSYGLFFKVAAAWTLKNVDLGLNIDLPYIEIKEEASFNYEEYLAGFGSGLDRFTFNNFTNLNSQRKYPLGISAGAGINIGKSTLHLNLSWNAKASRYKRIDIPELESETNDVPSLALEEELKSVTNFGVGAEVFIVENLNAYASFSSDYSPFKANASVFDVVNSEGDDINSNTDYFHYGFGVKVKHKWANFVLGGVYSSGSTTIARPIEFPLDEPTLTSQETDLHINRWRFIVGIEVLFLDKTKKSLGL